MFIQDSIIKTVLDNSSFVNDPSKIIITLDDVKYIQELSKIISFEKIIQNKYITLADLNDEEKIKIINIFLKKYNFLEKLEKKLYFNYSKMIEFKFNLEYFNRIFKDIKPDIKIVYEDKITKFYLWNNFSLNDKLIIGYMFFSIFNKIKHDESKNFKEYDFFTDVNINFNDNDLIEKFQDFFLKQFTIFINTSYGSVFGNYSFGSNLKNYVQLKYDYGINEKIKNDITGFINDISVIYNNSLELKNFKIEVIDDYSIKIIILIEINEELLQFEILKNN